MKKFSIWVMLGIFAIGVVVVAIGVIAGIFGYRYISEISGRSAANLQSIREDYLLMVMRASYSVNANELAEEWRDYFKAKYKYVPKIVVISGTVTKFDLEKDSAVVYVKSHPRPKVSQKFDVEKQEIVYVTSKGDPQDPIRCYMQERLIPILKKMEEGDSVKIVGTVLGSNVFDFIYMTA